jgi:hypothetical protein
MEKENTTTLNVPPRPAPRPDLDDFIFQDEGWQISDR